MHKNQPVVADLTPSFDLRAVERAWTPERAWQLLAIGVIIIGAVVLGGVQQAADHVVLADETPTTESATPTPERAAMLGSWSGTAGELTVALELTDNGLAQVSWADKSCLGSWSFAAGQALVWISCPQPTGQPQVAKWQWQANQLQLVAQDHWTWPIGLTLSHF